MPTPINELTRSELYTKADTYQELIEALDKRIAVLRTQFLPAIVSAELRSLRASLVDLELLHRREAKKQETAQKPL